MCLQSQIQKLTNQSIELSSLIAQLENRVSTVNETLNVHEVAFDDTPTFIDLWTVDHE